MKRSKSLKADPEKTRAWQQRSRDRALARQRESTPKPVAKPRRSTSGRARPSDPLAIWCEVAIDGVCTGRAEHRHHRKGRGRPELDARELTMDVCDACHRWVHQHPTISYQRGWMLKRTAS